MGRPLGSRNVTTLFGKEWTEKAVMYAKTVLQFRLEKGDLAAAQFVVKHFCPKPRGGLVTLDLPQIKTAADLLQAQNTVLQAVARGEIATGDGQALIAMTMQIAKTLRLVAPEQETQALPDREPLARSESCESADVSERDARGPEEDVTSPEPPPPIDLAPFAALNVPPGGTFDGPPDDDQCSLRRSRGAAVAAAVA
jgi:hypothetical protein